MWGHLFLKGPRFWSTSLHLLLFTPQPLFSDIRILWGPTGNRQVLTYQSYPHPRRPRRLAPARLPTPAGLCRSQRLSQRFQVYPFQARAGPLLFSWPGGGSTVPSEGLLTSHLPSPLKLPFPSSLVARLVHFLSHPHIEARGPPCAASRDRLLDAATTL